MVKHLAFEVEKSLNSLKMISNIKGKLSLSPEHRFILNKSTSIHPLIKLTKKQKSLSQVKLALASHTIESYEVFSEIESEPDEDIFRFGVSIALPIFNDKAEERQLLKLEQANHELTLRNQKKALSIELNTLKEENILLKEILKEYESLSYEQNRLLQMYHKGYRIAKTNLVTLEMSKKSFINNQEDMIKTHISIERNIIRMNYLRGGEDD
jgi:hypothetical protein